MVVDTPARLHTTDGNMAEYALNLASSLIQSAQPDMEIQQFQPNHKRAIWLKYVASELANSVSTQQLPSEAIGQYTKEDTNVLT